MDRTPDCPCSDEEVEVEEPPECACARDEHGLIVHERACLRYNHATYVYPPPTPPPHDDNSDDLLSLESEIAKLGVCVCGRAAAACTCKPARYTTEHEDLCLCCKYPTYKCKCDAEKKEALRKWRTERPITEEMPAVLEATHPLMQKFQETLRVFLEKENAIAEEEILNLSDELKLKRTQYDKDLEAIYRQDHDTNQQRVLIEEYEQVLATTTKEKQDQELKTKETVTMHKSVKEKLNQDIVTEREAKEELEALSMLVRQLEEWQRETESEMAVNQRMSEKMRQERKQRADEKRQLDMVVYRLNTEVWRLESEMALYQQQMKLKSSETEVVKERIATYTAELEDLNLEQRRLCSLWNSVLVNIAHRDKVFNSVKEDYHNLQQNYRTLLSNLEATKKSTTVEMNRSQLIAMNKDKIMYDIAAATKIFDVEDTKGIEYQTEIEQLQESVEMSEKDQELVKNENQGLEKMLRSATREMERRLEQKMELENEILSVMQNALLHDKSTDATAAAIRKIREMARNQEINLMQLENNHAKIVLDIELYRVRQKENEALRAAVDEKIAAREKEIDALEEQIAQNNLLILRRQRELDIVQKRLAALLEVCDAKSPQERRIEELERQISELRERTEVLQQDWLRLQGHVVRMQRQHRRQLADISLLQRQIQICDQKLMRMTAEAETRSAAREAVERSLRALRGRLEVLERARKEHADRNEDTHRTNLALTHEYTADLRGAEVELIQLEEDIVSMENEKVTLTQDLDRVQREAMVWQRKGILAVDLKKSIQAAKGEAGEIFKMKSEIHKMTVRREQLKRFGEKLASDLSLCVVRRDTVSEKVRASQALEKHGSTTTTQSHYKHKLRLARADVQRVTKDIETSQDKLESLAREEQRLQEEIAMVTEHNARLEERLATLQRDTHNALREKQWCLEKVVRSQRLDAELMSVIKKQAIKVSKPESAVVAEHELNKSFNESLREIVATVITDYPYVEGKLGTVLNTLNIDEPPESPCHDSPSYASVPCECE